MIKKIAYAGPSRGSVSIAVLFLALVAASAQEPANGGNAASSSGSQASTPSQTQNPATKGSSQAPTHITPDQAKQLFSLVDQLLKFSSDETGLPIKSEVKRRMTTRAEVESYLKEKLNDDEDARRMQRSEIVLKKFGLLDRDFDLKPFLLSLLKEQIEAYYDPKTKTVNLLDWVSVDDQKPVLAHELTHALQDQHVDLEKWSDATPPDVSLNSSDDTSHLAQDELDDAREAVTEGQATAVMIDSILKPMGHSLLKDPQVVELLKQQMTGSPDSPVLARAPLLLSETLMFPYREGLSFEQDIWMDEGQHAAFAGALDRPPTSTWEILNPREYEKKQIPPVPLLPDIHPLVDNLYRPYDIGQVGQLDVHILTGIFGGDDAARDLTPAWDGGLYWAGQLKSATPTQQNSTASVALFYLSAWKSPASARSFAHLYTDDLGRKYSGLKQIADTEHSTPAAGGQTGPEAHEQVFTTDEGPVVITTRGKLVFVSESFPLALARKLTTLILDAQGSGALHTAELSRPADSPVLLGSKHESYQPLSASFVRFLSSCGVMKSVVDAAVDAGR
ncbi:MAG TPA: hypothetical protein VMU48_05670 [Terracidiphilus sp.]|nr:hypothetical protein [Terracidiphilus sp.]